MSDIAEAKAAATELMSTGRFRKAMELIEPYLPRFPDDLELRWLAAQGYKHTFRKGSAEPHLRFIAERVPDLFQYQFAFAEFLFKAGRNREALPFLRRAVELEPAHPKALHFLACALEAADQYAEALPLIRRAVAADPQNRNLRDNLAEVEEAVANPPPPRAFARWPESVADFQDLPKLIREEVSAGVERHGFTLSREMKVFTQGSCFAGNLATGLRLKGFTVAQLPCTEEYNSTFANRVVVDWFLKGVFDARTKLVSETLGNRETYLSRLKDADLFVYTLGVAPVNFDKETGEFVMSRATAFSKAALFKRSRFVTSSVQENVDNLNHIIAGIRQIAPKAQVVLTVSPVPLKATNESRSAVMADCLSKSTLRVAVEDVIRQPDNTAIYWPSFEIVRWLGGHIGSVYGGDDGSTNHVNASMIELIVDAFVAHFSAP